MVKALNSMGVIDTMRGFGSRPKDGKNDFLRFPNESSHAPLASVAGINVTVAYPLGRFRERQLAMIGAFAGYCNGRHVVTLLELAA